MSAPLNSLTTGSYSKLEWRQTKGRNSELKADDRAIGTMAFRSSFGTFATAKIGDQCWTFKRVGFFQQRVEIRSCNSEAALGEFQNNTWANGGTLAMKGGPKFKATSNFWNSKWQVDDEKGRQLLRFEYGGVFKKKAHVKISAEARALDELPLLVALSWYLVVMLSEDSAAVVAT
jgi:hypothetical protein